MALMEQRVEGAWVAKQTAKGTVVATAIKRLRKAGGGMGVTRDDGAEVYSDGQRFGDRVDYVNTLVGEGNPVAMAQTGVLGYLVYLMMGAETVTGAAAPFTHTVTPAGTGFWFGAWKRVGETVIQRQRFNDCRMRSLRIEGSSANKVVKATPDFVSLDPGEIVATDPVKADDATVPWKHTEGEGRYLIDGTIHRGLASWAIVLNDAVTPGYGDSVVPFDVGFGMSEVQLDGLSLLLDPQGKDWYDRQTYGSVNPAAGVKPLRDLPALGSFEVDLLRGTGVTLEEFKATIPSARWAAPGPFEGNPEGGVPEIPMAASARVPAGVTPIITIVTKGADAAYT